MIPTLTTRAGLARRYGLDVRSKKLDAVKVVARLALGDGQVIDLYIDPQPQQSGIRNGYGINPNGAEWRKHLPEGE